MSASVLRRARRAILGLACALFAAAPVLAAPAASGYRLNPGDLIRLSVWKEDSLTREAMVQPDGNVSFPLAGQVPAAGRTAAELEAEVTDRIARYIAAPAVTIELLEAKGNRVYVLGEVNNPGQFQLDRPTSVVQAIALAGGLTAFAGRGDIRLLRREEGAERSIRLDFDALADGEVPEGGLELRAGDTIIVPGGSLF
jgi:polysaccharide export outer membrane protein